MFFPIKSYKHLNLSHFTLKSVVFSHLVFNIEHILINCQKIS